MRPGGAAVVRQLEQSRVFAFNVARNIIDNITSCGNVPDEVVPFRINHTVAVRVAGGVQVASQDGVAHVNHHRVVLVDQFSGTDADIGAVTGQIRVMFGFIVADTAALSNP